MVYTRYFTPNTHLGSKGDDILNSRGGSKDILYGGLGKDLLIASNKSDSLHGGKHADIFAFTHNKRASRSGDIKHAQVHTIMDFNPKEGDQIDLSDLVGYDKEHKIRYRGRKPFLGKGVEVRFIPGSVQATNGSKSRRAEGITGYPQGSSKEFFGLPIPDPFGTITKAIGNALGKVPVIDHPLKGTTDAVSTIQTAVDGNVQHIINLLPHGTPNKATLDPQSITASIPKGVTNMPSIASDGWPIPGTDATLSFAPEVKPSFNLKGPYLPKIKFKYYVVPVGLEGKFGADITGGINLSGTAILKTGSIPGSGNMPSVSYKLATATAPVPPPMTAGVSGSISVGQSIEITEEGVNKSVGFKVGASAGATLNVSTSPGVTNPYFNPSASLVGADDLTGIKYSASLGPGIGASVGLGVKIPGVGIDCGGDLIKGNLSYKLPLGFEIENTEANVTLGATLGVSADLMSIGCGPLSITAFPFNIASTNLGPKVVIPVT